MSMLNESDWETGMDYDPCDGHDHCTLCGVCGDENELVIEKWVPGCAFSDPRLEPTQCNSEHVYPEIECIRCHGLYLAEDCAGKEDTNALT